MSQLTVPLLDLRQQYQAIRKEVLEVVTAVCDSQQFILGPEVEKFEAACQAELGVKHAVGVSSGTDALILALMAAGVGPGDEVITSPYTFFATASSIARVGARPVFVDILPQSFNIDYSQIEAKLTKRTKAIMPVHLFGQCARMDVINDIAQAHLVSVIEDAAQAIGAKFADAQAGLLGTLGCLSFFPSKNLGGFGDGGMVTTDNEELANTLRILRVHGQVDRYEHHFLGGNFRLDALQAAVLGVKLRYLADWTQGRRQNAAIYQQLFNEAELNGTHLEAAPVILPTEEPQMYHVFNQYVIRCRRRNELMAHLQKKGVGVQVYYPIALHLQRCFAYLNHKPGDFPESEKAAAESLALPIFAELTQSQLQYVVQCIAEFYRM